MHVACYVRVSTEEQAKFGFSIEAQKTALINYCKENNYSYDFYIDEGISASSMKRPALQEMLKRLKEYKIILFTKLDRLSRNVLDANTINEMLKAHNVTMKAIDDEEIDTTNADGLFMFNLKLSLAQRELGKTSERINFVFSDKRKKGEVVSGKTKIGYKIVNKKYVIDNEKAEKVKKLYNFFVKVNGNVQLSYNYFLTLFPNLSYTTFSRILKDSAYIGLYKTRFLDNPIKGYVPAILDKKLFDTVQNLRIKKTRNSKFEHGLFDGLLVCYECNHNLVKQTKSTNLTIKYRCRIHSITKFDKKHRSCSNSFMMSESYIENYLLENIIKLANHYNVKISQSKKEKKESNNINEINIIKNKLIKLKDLYLNDLIDRETYKKDYENFNIRLKELINESQSHTQIKTKLVEIPLNFKETYVNLTKENKRKFWLSIIDKIYIEKKSIKEVIFL